jgi:hypothetical protein
MSLASTASNFCFSTFICLQSSQKIGLDGVGEIV